MIPPVVSSGLGQAKLIVEGWRFVPHSYAIVNQWQLLAMLRRNIPLKVVDAPLYRPWPMQEGLFERSAEQVLRSLPIAQPDERAELTLRIVAPFTFAPSLSPVTAVFATLEQQLIRRHQMASAEEHARLRGSPPPPHVKAVTPSRWSAEGFYRAGFAKERVVVVPHGVDPETFRPMADIRNQMRDRFGIADHEFVFLSIGAMTGNKGIDLLLRGFAEVCHRFPGVKLVLKGLDPLYHSRDLLLKSMSVLSVRDQRLVADRLLYVGESVSHAELARLYQVGDVYLSPYRAEGFNLPVLEAAACGLPIICTRGGPTDDFVTDDFARRIESRKMDIAVEGQQASQLVPDVDHLIALMASAVERPRWLQRAAAAGPRHVGGTYTWDHAVDTLIGELLG